MSSNNVFLINGLSPPSGGNEFQVRAGAVRLFAANLGILYNVEVYVGSVDDGAWVPAYLNSQQLQLSDTNNILVLIVAGQYRVVTNDGSLPTVDAMVWFEEEDETDHDLRVMYVLQTPSPPGGGSGPTINPSDTITDTGVDFSRSSDAGSSTDYSRGDHTHAYSALPSSVATDLLTVLAAATVAPAQYILSFGGAGTVWTVRDLIFGSATYGIDRSGSSSSYPIFSIPTTFSSLGYQFQLVSMSGYYQEYNDNLIVAIPCDSINGRAYYGITIDADSGKFPLQVSMFFTYALLVD